jgi:hypothetical protein
VQLKFAILTALASRPEGRATLDEIRREVEALTESEEGDKEEKRLRAFGDVDIFRSGLVVAEGETFQVTDAGRSALYALNNFSQPSLDVVPASTSLRLIDDLIGSEERLKIFDLALRDGAENSDLESQQEGPSDGPGATGSPAPGVEANSDNASEIGNSDGPEGSNHPDAADLKPSEPVAIDLVQTGLPEAPAFLVRSFGFGLQGAAQRPSRRSIASTLIAAKIRRALAIWRGHLERDVPNTMKERRTGTVGGGVFALLTLLVIILCAGAVASLTQIRSLKSEVASLERELFPLKERLAKIDQAEKMKRDLEQKEAQSKASQNSTSFSVSRVERISLSLSREEVQLIRDYIKPAPFTGTAAPAINVGDPITGGTIPLPSSLTEKIPKLVGARFAIRNGAIIIVKKDSRQADAVLGPN